MPTEEEERIKQWVDVVLVGCMVAVLLRVWSVQTPTRARRDVPWRSRVQTRPSVSPPRVVGRVSTRRPLTSPPRTSSPWRRPWREEEASSIPWTRVQRRASSTC